MKSKSKHYHMAAIALEVKVEDTVFEAKQNALHVTDVGRITAKDLGQIQQKAAQSYLKGLVARKLDITKVEILDAVILNIVPLGCFTEKEWMDGASDSMKKAAAAEAAEAASGPKLSVIDGGASSNEG